MSTDLAIEQGLVCACKTTGGLIGGRFRAADSVHKMYCCSLNHMSYVNEVMGNKLKTSTGLETRKHTGSHKSTMEKDWIAIGKVSAWFKDNDPFEENRPNDN